MRFDQITIIGVGLIGGSVGLAAKARGIARKVFGVGRDGRSLNRAQKIGAIDYQSTEPGMGLIRADLVVVCTPVDKIAGVILKVAKECRPGTLITDAGSTKGNILTTVNGYLPPGVEYVPAHPLAGSEKAGVEHARADLFEGRVTILTPTRQTEGVARVRTFWESLGSRVVEMTAEQHDTVLAITSHLPHAVASAVAGVTSPDLLSLTAGGFRDVTRVAAGDPKLWAAIFEANRECVLSALTAFTDRITEFRRLLEAGDRAGIERWLTEGKQVRDALGT